MESSALWPSYGTLLPASRRRKRCEPARNGSFVEFGGGRPPPHLRRKSSQRNSTNFRRDSMEASRRGPAGQRRAFSDARTGSQCRRCRAGARCQGAVCKSSSGTHVRNYFRGSAGKRLVTTELDLHSGGRNASPLFDAARTTRREDGTVVQE